MSLSITIPNLSGNALVGIAGIPFTMVLTVTGSYQTGLAFELVNSRFLPTGLTFDKGTGTISGTVAGPSASNSGMMQVIATAGDQASLSPAFSLNFAPRAAFTETASGPGGIQLQDPVLFPNAAHLVTDTLYFGIGDYGSLFSYACFQGTYNWRNTGGINVDDPCPLYSIVSGSLPPGTWAYPQGLNFLLMGQANKDARPSKGVGQTFSFKLSCTDPSGVTVQSSTVTLKSALYVEYPDSVGGVGKNLIIQPSYVEMDSAVVRGNFTATNLPNGFSIDPVTGIISGTSLDLGGFVGIVSVQCSFTRPDQTLGYAQNSFQVAIVGNVNRLLYLRDTYNCSEGGHLRIPGPVSTSGSISGLFSATGLPKGMAINPVTGVIDGYPVNVDPASTDKAFAWIHYVTVSLVASGSGGANAFVTGIVINVYRMGYYPNYERIGGTTNARFNPTACFVGKPSFAYLPLRAWAKYGPAYTGTPTYGTPQAISGQNFTQWLYHGYAPDPSWYAEMVGAAQCAYSVDSGSLPPGMALDVNNGFVQGVPTTPGAYSYVVACKDAFGAVTKTPAITTNVYNFNYSDLPANLRLNVLLKMKPTLEGPWKTPAFLPNYSIYVDSTGKPVYHTQVNTLYKSAEVNPGILLGNDDTTRAYLYDGSKVLAGDPQLPNNIDFATVKSGYWTQQPVYVQTGVGSYGALLYYIDPMAVLTTIYATSGNASGKLRTFETVTIDHATGYLTVHAPRYHPSNAAYQICPDGTLTSDKTSVEASYFALGPVGVVDGWDGSADISDYNVNPYRTSPPYYGSVNPMMSLITERRFGTVFGQFSYPGDGVTPQTVDLPLYTEQENVAFDFPGNILEMVAPFEFWVVRASHDGVPIDPVLNGTNVDGRPAFTYDGIKLSHDANDTIQVSGDAVNGYAYTGGRIFDTSGLSDSGKYDFTIMCRSLTNYEIAVAVFEIIVPPLPPVPVFTPGPRTPIINVRRYWLVSPPSGNS